MRRAGEGAEEALWKKGGEKKMKKTEEDRARLQKE